MNSLCGVCIFTCCCRRRRHRFCWNGDTAVWCMYMATASDQYLPYGYVIIKCRLCGTFYVVDPITAFRIESVMQLCMLAYEAHICVSLHHIQTTHTDTVCTLYNVHTTHYTCINKYVHVLNRLVYNRFKHVQCENGVQAYICKNHFERGMYSDSCCVGSTDVLSSRKQSQQ